MVKNRKRQKPSMSGNNGSTMSQKSAKTELGENIVDKELELEELPEIDIENVSNSLQSQIDKLQSAALEERLSACENIAIYSCDSKTIKTILNSQIPRNLVPLILDESPDIRQATLGALRNLSMSCSSLETEILIKLDVINLITTLIKKFTTGAMDFNNVITVDVLEQAVHVLWNICENNPEAVKLVNESNVAIHLLKYINPSSTPRLSISVAVAQCIYTLSDFNSSLQSLLCGTSVYSSLTSLLGTPSENHHQLLLRVLAAGILQTINNGSVAHSEMTPHILDLLNIVTSTNSLQEIRDLCEAISKNPKSLPRELIENCTHLLTAQQLSLEILANYCCVEDEDECEMDDSDGSFEELTDEDMQTDLQDSTDVSNQIVDLICVNNLLEKVTSLACPPSYDEVFKKMSESPALKNLQKQMVLVQSRALICGSNILSIVPNDKFGGATSLFNIWSNIVQRFHSESYVKEDEELLVAYTTVMRALADKLKELKATEFTAMTEADFSFLRNIAMSSENTEVKINLVRIISTIGCVLSSTHNKEHYAKLQLIGSFLLGIAVLNTVPLYVNAEALDCLFDVFAEDHLDGICKEINLVDRLQVLVPVLKKKFKEQRKSLGEHRAIVSAVKTNLVLFIKYKLK